MGFTASSSVRYLGKVCNFDEVQVIFYTLSAWKFLMRKLVGSPRHRSKIIMCPA